MSCILYECNGYVQCIVLFKDAIPMGNVIALFTDAKAKHDRPYGNSKSSSRPSLKIKSQTETTTLTIPSFVIFFAIAPYVFLRADYDDILLTAFDNTCSRTILIYVHIIMGLSI